MIIDGHVHIGIRLGLGQSIEKLIDKMDRENVDKSIVFNMVEVIDDNDYTAKAMETYPDRLIGFATINPRHANAREELIRSMKVLGLKGVKLHPTLHGYSFSDHLLLDPILEICTQFKVPIIGHGADDVFSVPLAYEEMARSFPKIPFVIAHMGAFFLSDQAIMVAKRTKNIFLGTEGAMMKHIQDAVNEVGAEKVVMGSDSPTHTTTLEMDKIKVAVGDSAKQKLITGDNWARLLKL